MFSRSSRVRSRRLSLEFLESRDTPALLSIGGSESLLHSDPDGDQVLISIVGSAGSVKLLELLGDDQGNEDGILDPGETIGQLIVSDASADFSILVTAVDASSHGDLSFDLGKLLFPDQVIQGLHTEPGSVGMRFRLTSFAGVGLSTGGGLSVDYLGHSPSDSSLELHSLSEGTLLDIRHSLQGSVLIGGDLVGALRVGEEWSGSFLVSGSILPSGSLFVGHNMSAATILTGDLLGELHVGGSLTGNWRVLGGVGIDSQITVEGGVSQFTVTRNFMGKLHADGGIFLDVHGAIGRTADLLGSTLVIYTGQSFFGTATGGSTIYVRAADSIGSMAKLFATRTITVAVGVRLIRGATLRASRVDVQYLPHLMRAGQVIGEAPFVITEPGYYRLAGHVVYNRSSGVAIDIRANNVVLDLQGYSVVGTAGSSTSATGIRVSNRDNVTILNGTVKGFLFGVVAQGNQPNRYTVERIRSQNWYVGIWVESTLARVRQNEILDTGGSTFRREYSIPIGLRVFGVGSLAHDNVISGFVRSKYTKEVVGMHVDAAPQGTVNGNFFVSNLPKYLTWGMWINGGGWGDYGRTNVLIVNNVFSNFAVATEFAPRSSGRVRANTSLLNDVSFRSLRGNMIDDGNLIL